MAWYDSTSLCLQTFTFYSNLPKYLFLANLQILEVSSFISHGEQHLEALALAWAFQTWLIKSPLIAHILPPTMSSETLVSNSQPPLTSLVSVILTTGPFLFSWSLLRQYITKNGPLPIAAGVASINNQVYAVFSALLSYLLIQSYLAPQSIIPGHETTVDLPFNLSIPYLNQSTFTISGLGLIYHYSKLYEYIDIFLLLAQGRVIGEHMAFHHISTPYLTYFRGLNCSRDDWRVFALANTVHHTVMYSYFGGLGYGWLRSITAVTGWAQLILGIGTDAWWMWRTNIGHDPSAVESLTKTEDETTNRAIALLLLLRYAMLRWNEGNTGRAGMSKEERERYRLAQGHKEQGTVENKKKT